MRIGYWTFWREASMLLDSSAQDSVECKRYPFFNPLPVLLNYCLGPWRCLLPQEHVMILHKLFFDVRFSLGIKTLLLLGCFDSFNCPHFLRATS